MYTAQIFHTKGCQKCRLTEMQLSPMPVDMELIDRMSNTNSDVISYMDKLNMLSAPLVRIFKDGVKVDEWNDFNIGKIKAWKAKVKDHGKAETSSNL